jgi:CheY-like chemotaxis protein
MNGGELARRLRQLPGCEWLVLVATTGLDGEEEAFRPYRDLFQHHIRKPFNLAQLESLLGALAGALNGGHSPVQRGM